MSGIERIAKERARQISEEGWTIEHDDEHRKGEMALAAACYATPIPLFKEKHSIDGFHFGDAWPWDKEWDKRKYAGAILISGVQVPLDERIRQLEKSGALIAAEIDRLLRLRESLKL